MVYFSKQIGDHESNLVWLKNERREGRNKGMNKRRFEDDDQDVEVLWVLVHRHAHRKFG